MNLIELLHGGFVSPKTPNVAQILGGEPQIEAGAPTLRCPSASPIAFSETPSRSNCTGVDCGFIVSSPRHTICELGSPTRDFLEGIWNERIATKPLTVRGHVVFGVGFRCGDCLRCLGVHRPRGTGSYLFQVAAAGLLAGVYTVRRYWSLLTSGLRSLSGPTVSSQEES